MDEVIERVLEVFARTGIMKLEVSSARRRHRDVYVTHPWVFHSIAANASPGPRLMRSLAIWAVRPAAIP